MDKSTMVLWAVFVLVMYLIIGFVVGRVMRNKAKKYNDYPKDWIDDSGFNWPFYVLGWSIELILNVISIIAEKLILTPLFWIVDKIVPNDDNVYESDYQREMREGKRTGRGI